MQQITEMKELSSDLKSLQNRLERLVNFEMESIKQQAAAWERLVKLFDEIQPDWITKQGTGIECAERLIMELHRNQKEV